MYNNKKCIWPHQFIKMISEGSCDIEDWIKNYVEISAFHLRNKVYFKIYSNINFILINNFTAFIVFLLNKCSLHEQKYDQIWYSLKTGKTLASHFISILTPSDLNYVPSFRKM